MVEILAAAAMCGIMLCWPLLVLALIEWLLER